MLSSACEKKIGGNFPGHQPKLVVNCLLDASTFFEVQISHTSIMTDTNNVLIDNAIVEIWMDDQLLEQLPYYSLGIYKSEDNKPLAGHKYGLIVSANGYETVTAIDSVPNPINLADAYYIFPAGTDIAGDPYPEFFFSFNDPADEENYYEAVLYTKSIQFYEGHYNNDTIAHINYFFVYSSNDPVLIAEGDLDYKPASVYFSDKLFNGKSVTISATTFNMGYGVRDDEPFLTGDSKIISFRSISYSYYQYRKKWTQHLYNQGINLDIQESEELKVFLFTGEPVNMYSNVENGYGVFDGYAASSMEMRKEE